MKIKNYLLYLRSKKINYNICIKCNFCINICPKKIFFINKKNINYKKCSFCNLCSINCSMNCI